MRLKPMSAMLIHISLGIITISQKLNNNASKTLMCCCIIILASMLTHDGDHLRQAFNWGYSIPVSLLVLNLVVYILPAVSIFLTKLKRASATLVTAFTGVFTTAGFLIIHLCGAFPGLWGVWNFSYFELIKGVIWQGVYYQGVDWISWIFLFEVPVLCLPSSFVAFRQYLKLKKESNNA